MTIKNNYLASKSNKNLASYLAIKFMKAIN